MSAALVDELLEYLDDDVIPTLTDDELLAVLTLLQGEVETPDLGGLQPHQAAPSDEDWEWGWMMAAGRDSGKTFAMARHFYRHAMGEPCIPNIPGGHRMAIVGPTLGDVASSCYAGPSGLWALDPRTRITTRQGSTLVIMPNGAEAKLVSGKNVEQAQRLRAYGNTCFIWLEELAAIPALTTIMNQVALSLRAGPKPRWAGSTTPVATVPYKRLAADPDVVVTHATTRDNVHGNKTWQDRQYARLGASRLGKQELEGIVLEDVAGALWRKRAIDAKRLTHHHLQAKVPRHDGEPFELWVRRALNLTRVYVGVDPATSGRGDRTGIVVVGRDNPQLRASWLPEPYLTAHLRRPDPRPWGFVLEDRTALMVPSRIDWGAAAGDDELPDDIGSWGDAVVDTLVRWYAEEADVEPNRLGRTARVVIRAAAQARGVRVGRIHDVHADTSKFNRADPVAEEWLARMWMVGELPGLEAEMTTWVPADGDDPDPDLPPPAADDDVTFTGSPDGIDGLVHAATRALGLETKPKKSGASFSLTAAIEEGWNSSPGPLRP